MAWEDAGPADAVAEGEMLGVSVGGAAIVLFRLVDGVFALHDLCPHGRARLSDGYVDEECVECPLHQGLIDIRTGEARSPPIEGPTRSYPARVLDGRIQVDV